MKGARLRKQQGVTLVELLATSAIALLVVAGLNGVVRTTLASKAMVEQRLDLSRQAEFAMARMARAVANSRLLLVPLADNPTSDWREHVREQTVPPSAPEGSSTEASAVLAVTLPAGFDSNFDGISDADNDNDGAIDEDLGIDAHNDLAPGISGVDDDGDGSVDDLLILVWDDDEDGALSAEDPINGIDDDGDGSIDENPAADANADGCSGICGVDDDRDGQIDESGSSNDDEDGANDEDWYDALVFYLDAGTLKERLPVPWDQNGDGSINGRDFLVSDLADQVTRVRFERVVSSNASPPLIDITLELTSADLQVVSLRRRVRIGSAL